MFTISLIDIYFHSIEQDLSIMFMACDNRRSILRNGRIAREYSLQSNDGDSGSSEKAKKRERLCYFLHEAE